MKMFEGLSKKIAIDLGTANTLIYEGNRGIVINEPTIVAVNNKTGQILAYGSEARQMLDRTPQHIDVIRPLVNGVISDFEMTEEILRHYFSRLGSGFLRRYGLAVVAVPTNLTEVERKSAEDAVMSAGAARVYLVEEPIAAALGARLPVEEPAANMIIDIGGGTTEMAIISVGGTVVSRSLKIAGDRWNEDIIKFVKDEFKMAIGEPTAERLKIGIGSALPIDEKSELAVRGRDLSSGLPKEIVLRNPHIRSAIAKSVRQLAEAARDLIESAPPELVGDILERGIYVSGGGSLLKGIDRFLEKEISAKVSLIDDPLTCVIRGLGMVAENFRNYAGLLDSQTRPKEIKI
jgi:rod shape-determining protein MreB